MFFCIVNRVYVCAKGVYICPVRLSSPFTSRNDKRTLQQEKDLMTKSLRGETKFKNASTILWLTLRYGWEHGLYEQRTLGSWKWIISWTEHFTNEEFQKSWNGEALDKHIEKLKEFFIHTSCSSSMSWGSQSEELQFVYTLVLPLHSKGLSTVYKKAIYGFPTGGWGFDDYLGRLRGNLRMTHLSAVVSQAQWVIIAASCLEEPWILPETHMGSSEPQLISWATNNNKNCNNNWIRHVSWREGLLKEVVEGKMNGKY